MLVPLIIMVEICVPLHHVCCQRGVTHSEMVKEDFSIQVLMNFGSLPSLTASLTPAGPLRWAMHCGMQPVSQLQWSSQGRGLSQEAPQVTGWSLTG